MQKIISVIFTFLIVFGFVYSEQGANNRFKMIKKSENVFMTPESVKYDEKRNNIYVANINGSPTKRDGNGFISKLNTEGEVVSLKWVTNLDAPKGMGIYKNYLYVTNIYEVVKIDINSGNIIKRIDLNGRFLNDIDIDKKGNVYVSDMATKKIYKIGKNDKYEEFFKNPVLTRPNGLRILNNQLYIGSLGSVYKLDLSNKKLVRVVDRLKNTDGVVFSRNNNLITSNFGGELFFYDFKKKKLYHQKLPHGSADIGINKEKNIIFVPDFKNKIYFYKLNSK